MNAKKYETSFLSPYYPIPCEDESSPITFFFTPLNLFTEEEFDAILKITDASSVTDKEKFEFRFKIFRSIFVKTKESPFDERLLSYKIKDQTKLNTFRFVKLKKMRDKKYIKGSKGINFVTGCSVKGKELIIRCLCLDTLLKQIKEKTLVNKVWSSEKYNRYLQLLEEQYTTNKDKLIPLQEGNFVEETTTLSDLKDFLVPECKTHKIGELIHAIKTSIGVKEFKKSKNFGRIYELRGEPIRYFYNEKNYTKLNSGSCSVLHNSCMRHNSCFDQLKFYSNNPKTIALLVVMDEEDPRKIVARTILWTTVEGEKAIDRIYCVNQLDQNILITYCKSMGYKTVYANGCGNYGLESIESTAVVSIENTEDTGLPYFDTMRYWERLNGLLSTSTRALKEHCVKNKLNYSLSQRSSYDEARSCFSIKGSSDPDFISDIYGNAIKDVKKVVIVDLPNKGYLNHENIELIGYPLKKVLRSAGEFIRKLKHKYNCIEEALCRKDSDTYIKYIDDKKNLVYSTVLKTYINRDDSYFNYNLNGYIYKESFHDPIIKDIYKERKLRSCYSHKSVHLTQEGYEYFKKLNENLIIPLDIIKIRPSRKFKIHPKNIKINGIILKNIIVPFKYLKIIKHNG